MSVYFISNGKRIYFDGCQDGRVLKMADGKMVSGPVAQEIKVCTQAEYDALTPDENMLYFIVE